MTTGIGVAEPLARALGWTLLHFCWQGIAVAAALWGLLALLGAKLSRARYAVACAALLLMVALPLGTFARLAQSELAARRLLPLPMVTIDAEAIPLDASPSPIPLKEQIEETLDRSAPWLPALWLAGVILFAVRLSFGIMIARRLRLTGTEPPPLELQHAFDRLRGRLGITRAVRLAHSAMVQVPTVIGWLRPVVLMPVSCLTGLSQMQIEAILSHELAHVRRHDYLVSVFQSVVETLLFYHPAVWWVSRQVRRERECCCDQLAVADGGDVLAYARALSWLEERRSATPALVLGANGGVLKMRIKRLLGLREGPAVSLPAVVTLLAILLAGSAVYLGGVAHAEARLKLARRSPIALIDTPASLSAKLSISTPAPFTAFAGAGAQQQDASPDTAGSSPAMASAYKNWLNQDAIWLITPPERAAFLRLTNDEERDAFINQFWARRNPPGAPADAYKQEIYRRIAYANQHFAGDSKPGWSTDRGHIYIAYGKPDWIESHPSLVAGSYAYEVWHYTSLPGIGDNITVNFVNTGDGDYHFTIQPQGAQNQNQSKPTDLAEVFRQSGAAVAMVRILAPPPVNAPSSSATPNDSDSKAAPPSAGGSAQQSGSIQGGVIDSTGAVVPRARVTIVNTATGASMTWITGNSGTFSFPGLPLGNYNLEVEARGFQRLLQENVNVHPDRPGVVPAILLKLAPGTVTESLTVNGNTQSAAPARPEVEQVRVSAARMAGQVISQPAPIYPPIALAAHVQGVVALHALISKTGAVESLNVLSGAPMLTKSAIEAVKQWTYRPYLLNGNPVAVETTINVNFSLPPESITSSSPETPNPLKRRLTDAAANGALRPTGPIRVSSGTVAGLAISQPNPIYPPDAKANHIQGVVVLHALISKTGDIENLQVVSGPEELRQATIDAVSQWKYKPFLLNGAPTEVETTINVNYALGDGSAVPPPPPPPPPPGESAVRILAPLTDSAGDPIRRIGGRVSAPVPLYEVEPEYSAQARAAKFMGVVLVNLIVDAHGDPQNVRILRGVGMGLDENAVAAVKQYRFRPAMENGKPVPVSLNIEVNFQIFDKNAPPSITPPAASTIRSIDFKGLNSVTIADVTSAFKSQRIGLALETPYDADRVQRAVTVLKSLLAANGHPNAIVEAKIGQLKPVGVSILFDVREGRSATVATIPRAHFQPAVFVGDAPPAAASDAPTDAAGNPIRQIGGSVTPPQVIYNVDPEFTPEARKAKVQALVLVGFIVDQEGHPESVHVVSGKLGDNRINEKVLAGLEQKAVEAVRQYRFKPAMDNGQPVSVAINVEVNFQIF